MMKSPVCLPWSSCSKWGTRFKLPRFKGVRVTSPRGSWQGQKTILWGDQWKQPVDIFMDEWSCLKQNLMELNQSIWSIKLSFRSIICTVSVNSWFTLCFSDQRPVLMFLLMYLLLVVSNAWLETLLSAINALPKETIKQEVHCPHLSLSALVSLCTCLMQHLSVSAGAEPSPVSVSAVSLSSGSFG